MKAKKNYYIPQELEGKELKYVSLNKLILGVKINDQK
jgi:hypothetical protein